ncbi:MAG: zinc-binding alcohol dehydrogenase [Anaerolineales bacterium]|nr:zinc-binding alcohol dehydrogenase [Anaerolineales bacterium]
MKSCTRRSLYFTAPYQVAVRQETLPMPGPGQALVRSLFSAISAGTESLLYRGQFPQELPVDETIPALAGDFSYPLKYGYCAAGQVTAAGPGVDPAWEGRHVFAFHPHESHFLAGMDELLPLPDGVAPEEAVFLPNMETAVNLVLDGRPLIGERVIVFGQGVVGLLTSALLARFPLDLLLSLDRLPLRRRASLDLGAHASLDPEAPETLQELQARLPGGADLVYELSGSPAALDQAIACAGFDGRVVIGSWYGKKRASLNLGGRFHRNRIQLISSQVSTLAPDLSGRWDKARRFEAAWKMLKQVRPARFITQRIPIQEAAQAYALLDQRPEEIIQVVLTYE